MNYDFSPQALQVVQLSSSYTGGAGIAARSLNKELNSLGISSTFASISKYGYEPEINETVIDRNLLEVLKSRTITKFQVSANSDMLLTPITLGLSGVNTFLESSSPSNTIIHIHNWYNLITLTMIDGLIANGFKVVLTLHDQRIFTGGCHFSLDCKGFQSNCSHCPEISVGKTLVKRTMAKQGYLHEVFSSVHFISPSKWLRSIALESKLMKNSRIDYIPNVLEVPELPPMEQARKPLLTLGVASMDPFLKIKGGRIVQDMVTSDKNRSRLRIEFLRDYPSSPENFWSAIDALLVPSEADNSPNVIFEAAIRGIPVIGAKVGGIPELLTPGFDLAVDFLKTSEDAWLDEFTDIKLEITPEKRQKRIEAASISNSAAIASHINLYSTILL